MTIIIGIDPGQSGGVAFIDTEAPQYQHAYPMPVAGKQVDWCALARLTHDARERASLQRDAIAYVEKVGAMPKQGVSSTFKFGVNVGGIHGVLAALGIGYELVTPQAWKKRVLAGTTKDKAAAIDFCSRRYPDVSLLATERSRKAHDGMADALCIAHYGMALERGDSA